VLRKVPTILLELKCRPSRPQQGRGWKEANIRKGLRNRRTGSRELF
jgi:hypothetical protein